MKLPLWALAATLVTLAACNDSPTEIACDTLPALSAGAVGDTLSAAEGLRYITLTLGPDTASTAQSCEAVAVKYSLMIQGQDSVLESNSFQFVPGQRRVIPGFERGVTGMRVGEERRLIIPPSLGYGAIPRTDQQGRVVIPANSTLIFDVELLAVE